MKASRILILSKDQEFNNIRFEGALRESAEVNRSSKAQPTENRWTKRS